VIIQLGAIFGNIISGIGAVAGQVLTQATPGLIGIGQSFIQRELNRKSTTGQRRVVQGQAVQALNTPGISVARLGGTLQPVGGRVQRATFTPAAFTPAQSPIGNIPLLPVGAPFPPRGLPFFGAGFPMQSNFPLGSPQFPRGGFPMANGATLPALPAGARGEPRFARDQFGKTIMFVPSPRPGEGFITLQSARQLGLSPTRPFWRFNRIEGQFEKIKPRRLNPFNFRATARAGRRVERTLDAVKELVKIERKMTTGKVRLKKRKKRKC